MLKIIAIVLVVLVAGLLACAAMRPDTFRVERSASVKAPPEKIFAQISDLKAWAAWKSQALRSLRRSSSSFDVGLANLKSITEK